MAAFQSVQYVDPFAPLPVGSTQAGVQAVLSTSGVPSGNVAYAQLLAGVTPIAYGTGATASSVRVFNTSPLAPSLAYLLQVQFGASGQNPADMDWSNPAVLLSAPVVTQQPRIIALSITSAGLTFAWQNPSGAAVAGGFLQIVDVTQNSLTQYFYLGVGPAGTVAATFTAGHNYAVTLSAVQPITAGTTGGFASPYTVGPGTTAQPIPTAAPGLTKLIYQDGQIDAQWTAPAAPANAPQPLYEILLLDGSNLVTAAPAGATGGQMLSSAVATLAGPGIGARMRYGDFIGPAGAVLAPQIHAPQVLGVVISGTASAATITATLASPGAIPTGGQIIATLYANGVAGTQQTWAAGKVVWTGIAAAANTVYEIDAALVVTNNGQVSQGPACARVATPLVVPQNLTAAYDGESMIIGLADAAGVAPDGYVVVLSADGASQTVMAAAQLPINFPAQLDLGKSWSVSVTPQLGLVSLLAASAPVSLPVVAPASLTSVIYDGATLTLQWNAAKLPFLNGYNVAVGGGPSVVTTGSQTGCAIALTPAQANGASVTVTALSPLRSGSASAAVSILAAPVVIGSVSVTGTVSAVWTVAGSPPAVRAELLVGATVQSVLSGSTPTGISFAIPAGAGPYRLRARASSADGVALGPVSAEVDLLLVAPKLLSGFLSQEQIVLRWDGGAAGAPRAFTLQATPGNGNPASFTATGESYEGPAAAAFNSAGTLSVMPANGLCNGPAATAPIGAAGRISTAVLTNGTLSVTTTLSGPSTDSVWFDVLDDGVLVSRTSVPANAAAAASLTVVLSEGSSASLRVSGVGPSSLIPASALAAIPTVSPVVLEAAYDGAVLHVSWLPSPGPGVSGYVVSIANGGVPDLYVPGAMASTAPVTVTLAYPFAAGISVSVRATCGAPNAQPYVQGSAGSAVLPVLAANLYSAAVTAAGNPPYLYRRGVYQALADVTGQPIKLYLPNPFTGGNTPTIPSSGPSAFTLAPAGGSPPLPYQLTLSADVWTSLGADAVRSGLRDSYISFLGLVEDAGVYPWAVSLIRQIIAQAMPQTFAEILYYRYGLWHSDALRVVDLTPGTRLQLASALYQSVVGGASAKNGFLATGGEMMELVDAIPQGGASVLPAGSGRSLSVDAFLSLIYPGGGSGTGRPVASGAIDFFDDSNRQPYYRLFYPPAPISSGSTGSTALESNVTLIGAMSWKTLEAVTKSYADTGIFPTGMSYFATYFRGRSSISPLVNVNILGESRWVTLGTSARQVLAAQGLAPYFGGNGGDAVSMRRGSANLFAYSSPSLDLTQDLVNLGNADLGGLSPLFWPLDMPLVGGDQLGLRSI